uniref:Protein kinase domain-containing protein n=2 Tax=Lotharella globosa TaxID=91324 RepID=A0A6V3K8Z3_9EUKA|mmetsp:Transcript_30880/g.59537  ORF Transcript_30880/g.59537 Transcript_30880/m.59537 type:complete len:289 (-) Transcript_30880:124-990(-)
MDTMKELLAMAQIKKHPNLVEFFGLVTVDKSVCFLVEFCEKGSLDRLHKKEDLLAKPKYLYIIRDVCSGLHVLHTARVIHRDLACRNLLMRQDGTVAISDYGLSRRLGASNAYIVKKSRFPWAWTSPESLASMHFTKKSDIWSLGITLWEIATKGAKPYGAHLTSTSKRTISKLIQAGELRVSIPDAIKKTQPFLSHVIDVCLRHDPDERPSALEILEKTELELKLDLKQGALTQPNTAESDLCGGRFGSTTVLRSDPTTLNQSQTATSSAAADKRINALRECIQCSH